MSINTANKCPLDHGHIYTEEQEILKQVGLPYSDTLSLAFKLAILIDILKFIPLDIDQMEISRGKGS